jgi:phosphotriesterase-related protein
MKRRTFLKSTLAGAAGSALIMRNASSAGNQTMLQTVRGPVPAESAGVMLPHEHLMVDFVGADKVSRDRYDADAVYNAVLPHLQKAKDLGVDTLVECTPAYLARDAALLKRWSEAVGIHILTNTGYYGASNDQFVPAHAYEESAEQLAARWVAEWKDGIEDTGIRPGFIKTAVDNGELSDIDEKLLRAAAKTQRTTGLTIGCHTTEARAARDVLTLLKEEDVPAGRFIWIHAQTVDDGPLHAEFARAGYWVEFDGISPDSVDLHLRRLQRMKHENLLDRVLVSHDAGWYSVGEPEGGDFRDFDTLFTQFLPALREADFSDEQIEQLTRQNPQTAFAVEKNSLYGASMRSGGADG